MVYFHYFQDFQPFYIRQTRYTRELRKKVGAKCPPEFWIWVNMSPFHDFVQNVLEQNVLGTFCLLGQNVCWPCFPLRYHEVGLILLAIYFTL